MPLKYMTAEQLRRFIRVHREADYLIVDVREPEEYRRGHIPGARLMPVRQLVRSLDRLPSDRSLVFYCHNGGRSMAAAVMAAEENEHQPIFNLNGGMMAWDGVRLADIPRVRHFEGQTAAQMFQTAIDLEKGAQRFYEAAAARWAGHPRVSVFDRLAAAEVAHARTIYGFWRKIDAELAPFDDLYDRMPGDVLEGGLPLQAVMQQLAEQAADGFRRYLETALQVEYAAYDLYRTMADQADEEASRQTFMALAQAEKAHMQVLIEMVE